MIPLVSLADIGNTIMTPFYWLISSVLVLFHQILTPVFGSSHPAQGWVWLLSIVLMSCLIRGATLPLYAKQLNSQRAMTSLQPKMKELQKKYAGDRQRQSAETMKLYQEEGVSPYASCLPMLVQLPILMSVYWSIRGIAYNDVKVPLKGLFSTFQTYTPAFDKDGVSILGSRMRDSFMNASILNAKLSESFTSASTFSTKAIIVVLVLVMMGTLFYQQWYMMRRNMPPSMLEGPMGQQQKVMLYIMPLMYLFSGAIMPMGILLYWLVSNVWTMGQQYFMVRIYPTKDTPAYAEWEDRMIRQGKDPAAIEKARVEKARSKKAPKTGGFAAKMAQLAEQQGAGVGQAGEEAVRTVNSQVVTRADPATGKQVVVRKQVRNVSRAKRKH